METIALWCGFIAALAALLVLDLFVVHREAHIIKVREALFWSGIWIALALSFAGGVFAFGGPGKGTEFLSGYIIEKSLSVDNVFIFLIVFQYFAVPPLYQPKVLHYGIIGALGMRLVFVLAGAALLAAFHWMIFVFGGLLLLTAARLAVQKEHEVHPEKNPLIRLMRRFVPMTDRYEGGRFFVRQNGLLAATPLFAVLVIIESTDLIFAIDSIPAIFAVTRDPFIVFASNAFAILGLRALYFALAGVMPYFTFLRQGLVGILAFVGVKMLISDWYKMPTLTSLVVVGGILLFAIGASVLLRKPVPEQEEAAAGHQMAHKPIIMGASDQSGRKE